MLSKQKRYGTVTWMKIIFIFVIGISGKIFYDGLASEGDPWTAFLFKVRAPYLDPSYLQRVMPTAFTMIKDEDTLTFDSGGESFKIEYESRYPQVEYYGQVLSRSPINKLIQGHFLTVESQMIEYLKKDAERHLKEKSLVPGFGKQLGHFRIRADVSYFSKSVLSIRYRVTWDFGGSKHLYSVTRYAGYSLDIPGNRPLALRDIIAYPYPDFLTLFWSRVESDLNDRNLDLALFNLNTDEPEFYITPSGIVVVHLSEAPQYLDADVKIPFFENRRLFRSNGAIGHLNQPSVSK